MDRALQSDHLTLALPVDVVAAYLSAGACGLFPLAVFGVQQGYTEYLKAFPRGEHGEVGRLAEGAVTGLFHVQPASAVGAYEGLPVFRNGVTQIGG